MQKAPKPGTVVIWTPDGFNPEFWSNLSEEDRKRYYGWAGYGSPKKKLFVFICPIFDADGSDSGHCVLLDMDDGHLEHMRHTIELRLATEDEF